jgi:ubiquinone/menaquinone biosynthesis C-methylase UbiE
MKIGCGRDYRPGWFNTDISREIECEQYLDIGKDQLKLADGEADYVYISGVLEQIGPNEQLLHALNECWRVLQPGCQIEIVVPNAKYAIAHRDPMDIRKFTPDTFRYFIEDTQEYRHYGSVYGFKPWHDLHIEENQRHILTVTMRK